jgi:hypothetical protein
VLACSMEGATQAQDPKGTRDWRRSILSDRDFFDSSSRRESWREEERGENNNSNNNKSLVPPPPPPLPSPRRDYHRWKEGGGDRDRAPVEQISSPLALQNHRRSSINNERRTEHHHHNNNNNMMAVGREPVEPPPPPPLLRRVSPSERWAAVDTNSREPNYDSRRDSKWSTRWGPEDKDSSREVVRGPRDGGHDKEVLADGGGGGGGGGYHHQHHHVTTLNSSSSRDYERDRDRELDSGARADRAWRSPSLASRGRGGGGGGGGGGEALPPPSGTTPPKMAPGFGIGRGRGDPTGLGFAIGRGRANFTGSGILQGPPLSSPISGSASAISSLLDKWNGRGSRDDSNAFHYPRTKLLDIYRKVGILPSFKKYPEGFIAVQLLTQEKVSEPLAFITPDMEEEVRKILLFCWREICEMQFYDVPDFFP